MSAEGYRLGGVTPVPWMTRGKLMSLLSLGAVGVLIAIAILITQSIVLIGVLVVLIGVIVWLSRRRQSDGSPWALRVGESLRTAIGTRAKWDSFDPVRDSQPFLLPPLQVVGVSGPQNSELAVLQYADAMACVLEVSGPAHGVKDQRILAREANRVNQLHRTLADPRFCLTQVDWVTLVRPEATSTVAEGFLDRIVVSSQARASLEELPAQIAAAAETVRSFVVLRFSTDELYSRVVEPPYTESSGPEAVYIAASMVASEIANRGIDVVRALATAEVAALARGIIDPDHDSYDIAGCDGRLWDALPGWDHDDDGVVTEEGWHHATATLSRKDWPLEAVHGRWLEEFVFAHDLGPRLVVTQIALDRRFWARGFVQDQLLTASSKRYRRHARGVIDGGESAVEESVASVVAREITVEGQTGMVPMVRFQVSGRTARQLRRRKDALFALMTDTMNAEGLTWDDTRPGVGLLHVLPLALEVPHR